MMLYYLIKYVYHRIRTPFYGVGWRVAFSRGVTIKKSQYIKIGRNVFFGKDALIQVEPFHHLEFGSHKPKLKIGNYVSIGTGTEVSAVNDIEIEDDVIIAGHCHIADNSHRYDRVDTSIRYQGLDKVNPVKIKKGAWICWGVVVCPGVTIGKNSIIGANSVVKENIPDYCVAAGTPARVVKKYDFELGAWVKID